MSSAALRLFLVLTLLLPVASCQRAARPPKTKLTAVATLFPVYDFARAVAGDRAELLLLIPPGVEPHAYEPVPTYFMMVRDADLFLFTGSAMEPWALKMLGGIDARRMAVVDTSVGIPLRPEDAEEGSTHTRREEPHGGDPHIWLDLGNAAKMVDTIANAFCAKDPKNAEHYRSNAAAYKAKLAELDARYAEGLKNCAKPVMVHGGHFAFGYLSARYHIQYAAALGFSPQAEPLPARMAQLVRLVREKGVKTIFYEELINPNVAEAVARETGAELVQVHAAHNLTREEFERGATFLSIMEENLRKLKKGLECNGN